MSSLRISHQNRAIAAPAGGSRSDHAEDGGSFSVALGAAAGMASRGATALLDGKTGGMTGDGTESRKRADAKAKASDAAAAAGVAASLVATPGLPGAAVTVGSAGSDSALTGSAAAASAIGAAGPTGKGAVFDQGGALPIGTAVGVDPGAAGANSAIASQSIAAAPHAMAGALASGMPTVTASADPGFAATSSAASAQPVQGQVSVPDPGSLVALVPLPKGIRQPAPATSAAPAASSADPTGGAPTDPSGGALLPALTAPTGPTGPSPSNAHALANTAAGALSAVPLAAAQAAVADGGGYAATNRGRYATPDTAPDASSVAAAATTGAGGGATLAAPSAAAASAPAGPGGDAGTIGDQVAGQLARMVSTGPREMVMRLRPPELGDLTVRVAVSGRDVSAWFASPQPQVQNAISAALGQLQASLGNAGYNLNGAWVGADASGGRPQQNPSPLPAAPAALAPPAALSATAISRPASSGLNIYV